MKAILLRFYLHENDHHNGFLAWEILIRYANKAGISGCSVFKAIAGFGSHHVVHEGSRPFQLNTAQTLKMEFLVTDTEARQLMDWARQEKLRLFYTTGPASLGTINPDST